MRPALLVLASLLLAGCSLPDQDATNATTTSPPATSTVPVASPSPIGPEPGAGGLACATPACATVAMRSGAEPWIAVDPNDPLRAVVAAMAMRTNASVSHPWLSVATTTDGGASWLLVQPPGGVSDPQGPFGSADFAADATVAFAKDGVVVLAGLVGTGTPFFCSFEAGLCTPSLASARTLDLVTWRSTDGGKTFQPGPVVDTGRGLVGGASVPGVPVGGAAPVGSYPDREALAASRDGSLLVLAWDRIGPTPEDPEALQHLMVSTSTDAGASWSEPRRIAAGAYGASVATEGGVIVVTARDVQKGVFFSWRSPDAGETWEAPVELGPVSGYDLAPVALWPDNGTIRALVAYPGPKGAGVVLRASADGGASWSNETAPLLGGEATLRRLPGLALDARGDGVLATYQQRDGEDDLVAVGVAIRAGAPAGEPLMLSEQGATRQAAFDYLGTAATTGGAWVAWGASGGNGGIQVLAIPVKV